MIMDWHKSSYSGAGNCVEVNIRPVTVFVRDTKHRDQPYLAFTHEEWSAFLHGVKNGEFDIPIP